MKVSFGATWPAKFQDFAVHRWSGEIRNSPRWFWRSARYLVRFLEFTFSPFVNLLIARLPITDKTAGEVTTHGYRLRVAVNRIFCFTAPGTFIASIKFYRAILLNSRRGLVENEKFSSHAIFPRDIRYWDQPHFEIRNRYYRGYTLFRALLSFSSILVTNVFQYVLIFFVRRKWCFIFSDCFQIAIDDNFVFYLIF